MMFLTELLVRGVAIAAIAIVVTHVPVLRAARARAAVLTVALCWLALLPLGVVIGPRLSVAVLPASALEGRAPVLEEHTAGVGDRAGGSFERANAQTPSPDVAVSHVGLQRAGALANVLVGLSYAGVAFLIVAFRLAGLRRAAAQVLAARSTRSAALTRTAAGAARDLGWSTSVRLKVSDAVPLPFVSGLFRPTVVVPADSVTWSDVRVRAVLLHEIAHLKRRDLVTRLATDLACAVNWCNPLAWMAARRLRIETEVACDDLVLAAGVPSDVYATELVQLARAASTRVIEPACGIGAASDLRQRVQWILAERSPAIRERHLTAAIVSLCVLFGVASFVLPVSAQAPTGQAPTAVSVSNGGPEISANGAGIQARWADHGRHSALFVTGDVDLSDATNGRIRGGGSLVLIEEANAGVDVFEWRSGANAALSDSVRRSLGVGFAQVRRLAGDHSQGLPGSTLTGLPAVSEDPSANVIQAGWLDGEHRFGLAQRGHWRIVNGELSTTDSRAWFVACEVDRTTGSTRRVQVTSYAGVPVARVFKDGVEAAMDREAGTWATSALRTLQRIAPDIAGR